MPQKNYSNPEYIDWLDGTDFEGQTELVDGGPARATRPAKMNLREFVLTISGPMAGAIARIEYSPDFMETPVDQLVMDDMDWFSRDDAEFTVPADANVWENVKGAEGWFRIYFENIQPTTNPKVSTRPNITGTV